MKILKFGGSSVGTPERVRRLVGIVTEARRDGEVAVVVSAFEGVTNALLEAADAAARRNDAYLDRWSALRARHHQAAEALAALPEQDALLRTIELRCNDLRDLLHGVFLLRECSPRTRDSIVSYGERLSAPIVAAALRDVQIDADPCDARSLIVTDARFGRARVDLDATYPRIRAYLEAHVGSVAVITGFIAATMGDQTTTLGRGGSDYTAALVGAAVEADAIELWTDVDGVLSADPRLVENAFPLRVLSYDELMELSHFGAKVVYPPSIQPARSAGIPLVIKNTLEPNAAGSRIVASAPPSTRPVRGVSSIDTVCLMRLEGAGMIGVPGIAARLFSALAKAEVSVILISQASSEHSICFAVAPEDAERAQQVLNEAFALERDAGLVEDLVIESDVAVVAAVGEAMREQPGISAQLFGALAHAQINIRAIAQGSSERNVSVVVTRSDVQRAVRAVHRAFFGPPNERVDVVVAGAGTVGGALLDQLADAEAQLADDGIDLRVVAIVTGSKQLRDAEGVALDDWRAALVEAPARDAFVDADAARNADAEAAFDDVILGLGLDDHPSVDAVVPGLFDAFPPAVGRARVFVDCTASAEVGADYGELLRRGASIVSANKLPFAEAPERVAALRETARRGGVGLRFEATVGAGLPVVATLDGLVRTGDRLTRLDGVLSGSLNAMLDRVDAGAALSEAVGAARDAGLTEPHPWDDLSGEDVARKLCILARLAGREDVVREDVAVTPLLDPAVYADLDDDAFWQALPAADAAFAARHAAARAAGQRLRYVATIDDDGARVGLEAVDAEHPAYAARGPENLIALTTARYAEVPLTVRGPGAGPAVTAAGVFADLLMIVDAVRRV
ncbi:MAG: aspartate kinase [Acidobacteriota bacterium]